MKKLYACLAVLSAMAISVSCTSTDPNDPGDFDPFNPGGISGGGSDDGTPPAFDPIIREWDGTVADDIERDIIGTDKDIFHELNTFDKKVRISYSEQGASVTTDDPAILCTVSGGYVTVDMLTNAVSGTEIELSGKCSDGALKVYGASKFKLTLNGVELASQRGPAINSQCKKRIFVHLVEGSTNRLTDVMGYTDDPYYIPGSDASAEDRKGCFFSEGNLVFSGAGTLIVAGKSKHGVATDGYLWMRPGVTIVVNEAAKNAIHVKGNTDDNIGVHIAGGLVYANVGGSAGKGIKTDLNVEVEGGKLLLNTSGEAVYDEDEKDTSSAAGIKADGNVIISGGTHTLKSTGMAGKGINADGEVHIKGGETTVTTTGGKYYYTSTVTSSPKGIKADGNVEISGGKLNISVTGVSDGSEGLESKAVMDISGGEIYVYAYDDAINASKAINITGGKVFAYAKNNDGIDSNGTLTISGGLVIGVGANAPESGIDCDNTEDFHINGGTVIAVGGSLQQAPSSKSVQLCVVYNGVTAAKDAKLSVLNSSGAPILTFAMPRSISSSSFFFSTPLLAKGATYKLASNGTISDYTDSWQGWYGGGKWSGGSDIGSFTTSSVITTVGSGGGMGGPGGGPGWH